MQSKIHTAILEISKEDIAALNDIDLRSLIGLLCEAELSQLGISTKSVSWSGHQNAPDEGLDVAADYEGYPNPNSFVPAASVGFQVKKSDLTRSRILEEMRPNGILRESIISLEIKKGAYIIASGASDLSPRQFSNRIKAMQDALGHDKQGILTVDFYDANRIASWTRKFPSLVLWVKNKISRPMLGWYPYMNWSGSAGDMQFIIDKKISIRHAHDQFVRIKDTLQAIAFLRDNLRQVGRSVRLVGLSGVGKTRLTQALFEEGWEILH